MISPGSALRRGMLITVLLVAGWAGGGVLSRHTTPVAPPTADPADTTAYRASVMHLDGALSLAASRLAPVAAHPAEWRGYTVALIRGADWYSCEDLGRQLRELERGIPSSSALLVWTEAGDVEAVRHRLRREKIRARVSAGSLDHIFFSPRRIPTPAVLRLSRDGTRAAGVAHTRRFPNVRARSFAYELGLLTDHGR